MPSISPSPLLIYYIIYTTDSALAAAWLAANPSGVVSAGPNHLASTVGLTVNYSPTAIPDPSGCWFQYFPDGSYAHIALLDKSVDSGIIDPNDFYAIATPPNTNWDPIQYIWQGSIFPFYTTAPGGSTTVQLRYWACGFELGAAGNGALALANGACCPAASRTTDGYGFGVQAGGGAGDLTMWTTVPPGSGTLPNGTWERIYIRPWVRPNQGEVAIWSCHDNLEGTDAAFLTMDPSGALVFRNVGNAGVPGTVLGTSSPLPLNTWAKLDLTFKFRVPGTPDTPAAYALSINGVVAFSGSIPLASSSGLSTSNAKHQSSKVGAAQTFPVGGLSPTQYKYDLDDWIGVNVPFAPGAPATIDYTAGTHIRLANVNGVAAAGAWTGDYRGLAGNPPGSGTFNQMASTTPNTQLILTTDFVNLPQLGVASVMVQMWPAAWPGSTVPKVGFRFNGGTLIQNTGTQVGSFTQFCGQLFNLAPVRTDWTTLDISMDKDATSFNVILAGMWASIEYVGFWGPEDVYPGTTPVRAPLPRTGLHNAPYPEIAAAASPQNTMAWASARQGTYVGNGTGQDIAVGVPFHWLWIRNLTTNQSQYWFSSHCAAHQAIDGSIAGPRDANFPLPYPPSGDATSFHVSTNSNFINANGVTYQWVAFSDPDSRFLLNGAAAWDQTKFPSAVNTFQDPAFTPTCVFTSQEDMSSSIGGFYYKGPGNPGDTASVFTAGDASGVMTFAAGTLTTKSAHYRAPQMAYGAWRTVDGTGASGVIDCVTYTGNGVSSRNIAVNLGGNSPLFAMGIAHTVASYYRDPSHSGLDSTQFGSGLNSSAIIGGGINYVTVGASLNITGRVYDIWVLAGSPYAGTWTPPVDPGTPGVPVVPPGVPPVTPAPGPPPAGGPPPIVVPPHGWFLSDAGYRGDVTAIGDSKPANPRSWKDFVGFATGAAAMLGGSPGIAAIVRNRLIYAASGYVVGTSAPSLHIFDGTYDRELVKIPAAAGVVARGIVSLLAANGTVYLSTWDAGTTSATWTGRIFSIEIESATLTQIGDALPTGHLPYALAFLNSALWCGSHRGDSSPGSVFRLRPGVDTAWALDRDLATDSMAGVAALGAINGTLFVGATAAAGSFAKVLSRATSGTYVTAFIGAGGAATALNGFLAFASFKSGIYASYWNNDTTAISRIYRSVDNGVTWTLQYSGAAGTLRPFIVLIVDQGTLYALGGGLGLTAAIVASDDGVTWTDLTPQLPETDKTLAPAAGVLVF